MTVILSTLKPTGVNTGDETLATIKTKLGVTTLSGSNTGDQIIPTTLPASDVYAWAKAAVKPDYTAAEVGAPAGSGTSTGTNTGDQVIPVASSTIPAALGTAAIGVGSTFARADHVHAAPTTVSGNAGSATILQTARTINGVSFNGSANITINAVDSTARVAASLLGAPNGVATLDATGVIPNTQLPSYVDDVLEYANLAAFPATGTAGKIYVALDTNKTYRWSGTVYIFITSGAVDSVAGKTGVVTLVKGDVGLGSVDNTPDANKPVSTLQATANTTVQTAAASDATTKANAAQAAAISAAATDATSKANAAQAAAIAASTPVAHAGAGGAAHANVVASGAAGFMTGADKAKLDTLVNWLLPTAVKTANYTAVSGELVRVDSTTAAFTVTLPSAPTDGNRVAVLDVVSNCGTNAVLIAAAGSKTVEFDAIGLSTNINGAYVELIYNSVNNNWKMLG